jgi:hypothetical protein
MISANTDLTPKWKAGISTVMICAKGSYFHTNSFRTRFIELRMDFNWTPFGTNANWGFFIGINQGAK